MKGSPMFNPKSYPTAEDILAGTVESVKWEKLKEEVLFLVEKLTNMTAQGHLFLAIRNPWTSKLEIEYYLKESSILLQSAEDFYYYLTDLLDVLQEKTGFKTDSNTVKDRAGVMHYVEFLELTNWFKSLGSNLTAVRHDVIWKCRQS